MGNEQPPQYYNSCYKNSKEYDGPYSESVYYDIWKILASHLPDDKMSPIIDLGCGPGQLAEMLYDEGWKRYLGIDFSGTAIGKAIDRVDAEGFAFAYGDLRTCEIPDGDAYVLTEVLEHIANDLSVLEKIPRGKTIIGTVPDFDCISHVRYFESTEEIKERYNKLIDFEFVDKYGHLYLFKGVKKDNG